MEHLQCHLKSLSRDLLADIMFRLDGSALASAACTCSELLGIARDQSLWKQLCHTTWPSTALKEGQHVITSSAMDGFHRFYADSYPLILHDQDTSNFPMQTHISPSNFASFVDVYYSDKCILSRVLDGIPRAADVCEDETTDLSTWLLNCPFKLVLMDTDLDEGTGDGNELLQSSNIEYGCNQISAPPFMLLQQIGKSTDPCKELRWKEISMRFEDTTGAFINGGKSLIIMNQALHCLRSNNSQKFWFKISA